MVRYKEYEHEVFKCLLLNTKYEVVKVVDVSHGTLDGTLAGPRDVFRQALREGVSAVILCHNHPSGDPSASSEDVAVTRALVDAGKLLDCAVLDHLVLGSGGVRWVSMKERGLGFNR